MPDINQLITDNLNIWSSTVKKKNAVGRGSSKKIDLYGIKKLRELILELAIRGLLVSQDANDEPAGDLLKSIHANKTKLIKEKLLKKRKEVPELNENESAFQLPKGWKWARLQNACIKITDGSHNPPPDSGNGYPMLSSQNVKNNQIDFNSPSRYLTEQDFIKEDRRTAIEPDDILLNIVASIGRSAVVPEDAPKFALQRSVAVLSTQLNPHYFARMLVSPLCLDYYNKHAKGTAQKGIYLGKLSLMPLAVSPLQEQKRIVAKVDELMALCDQLEQQQEDSISAHQTLVKTLLDALVDSASHSQTTEGKTKFEQAWGRIAEHFDTLFTTEDSIDQLKQTILQLAVMGKLVPQDLSDEPASELLKKVAAEKAQLAKDGKIKKKKEYITFAGLDGLKTRIPDSWNWVRLADIAEIVRGGSPRPAGDPRYYDGDIPFLKVGDVTRKSGKLVEGFNATIKEAGLYKTRLIESRTVLLSNSGATLGIPAICDFTATFNDGIAAFIQESEFVFDEYLYLYLANLSKWFLNIASRGQGQPNLNTDIIKSTWFAFPPLEEQHRIVAKADELMALCETLKTNINNAQATQLKMADAISNQAVA